MAIPAGPPTKGGTALISLVDDRIRLTELETATHHVDLLQSGLHWRLGTTPHGSKTCDRWWEYDETDPLVAVRAAYAWHQEHRCAVGTEPAGWRRSGAAAGAAQTSSSSN